MNWNSVQEFMAMGGYACYVWGAFGACAAALTLEVMLLRGRFASFAKRSGGGPAR